MAREALEFKQDELLRIENALLELRKKYEESVSRKEKLAAQIGDTRIKLKRANKITVGLADEQVRWSEQVCELDSSVAYTPGDTFLCAAMLIYFGPLPVAYRNFLQRKIMTR